MSSLWLLEAKAYPEENRSAEAISKRYWLRPGTYTVGRPGTSSDIALLEDKSISRNHAIVIVPSLQEWLHTGAPYVEIKDTSRYGTLVAERNDLQADGVTKQTLRAFDRYMLRFGYQSPFK